MKKNSQDYKINKIANRMKKLSQDYKINKIEKIYFHVDYNLVNLVILA